MDINEARRHAGPLLGHGDNCPAWAEERAKLIIPHYVWTWQEGRHKHGVATCCGQRLERLDKMRIAMPDEYEPEKEFMGTSRVTWFRQHWDGTAQHGRAGLCPYCGREVEFRSLAKGYGSMEDKLFFVVYRRSAIDPRAVVCVGYRIFIPWRDMDVYGRLEAPMNITPMEICVFRWGKGGQRFVRETAWYMTDRRAGTRSNRNVWTKCVTDRWSRRSRCESGYTGQNAYMGNDSTAVVLDCTALKDAVEGTLWERCLDEMPWTEAGQFYDRITLLDRISRYPCVEYLLKLGYTELARVAVDHKGGGEMNLRGKTARDVLRLTEDEWGWIKGHKVTVYFELLRVIHYRRKRGLRLSMELCKRIADSRDGGTLESLRDKYPHIDLVKACKYAYRQQARLGDYWDYLRQCGELGADLTSRQVLWPRNLHEIHQRYTVQLRQMYAERRAAYYARNSEKVDENKLAKLAKALAVQYSFRACGLVLEPFATATEIIQEGAKLNICIGDYVNQYADGGTILCKLRREDSPDVPWHAVEFSTQGRMVQCRGYENKTLDVDEQLIRDFWAAWDAARGTRTTVSLRIQKTAKEARIA